MTEYEKTARANGFRIHKFGDTEKIARSENDGTYVVSANGWRYACEDSGIELSSPGKAKA